MKHEAWVAAVDMGYGHQRAAFPLRFLSPSQTILIANNYQGIPKKDSTLWNSTRTLYEVISRLHTVPLIGPPLFSFMDSFQRIPEFYPRRDLSKPSLQLRQIYRYIQKGWGEDFVRFLNSKNIPLITTFFTVAYFAEEHHFKNDIYLVVCDTDMSRAWAPLRPEKSRIKYLAPTRRVVDRLKLYGVKESNIFFTGFPLPEENTGDYLKILKKDLAERIVNLDPLKQYRQKYSETIKQFVHGINLNERHHHPLTLTFAVGGAGAQRVIAEAILMSLKKKLLKGEVNLNLVAGSRNDVYLYFRKKINEFGLKKVFQKHLHIIFASSKEEYFGVFNEILRTTDVLWTKPSELSFYSALGIPIIIAPPLGCQEMFNRTWLETIGGGLVQGDPAYTHEWFFDWVKSGWLAEAAMSGFLGGSQFGVQSIMDVVFHNVKDPAKQYQLI
jgi:hypothetical protein